MASSLDDPGRGLFLSLFGEAPKKRVESQEERDISASTSAETPREAAQQPQPSAPVQHPSHPSTAPAARHLDAINVDAPGVPKLSTLCLQKLRAQRTRVVVDANIPDSQLKTIYQGASIEELERCERIHPQRQTLVSRMAWQHLWRDAVKSHLRHQKHVLDQRKPKQSWRTFYLTIKQKQQERLKAASAMAKEKYRESEDSKKSINVVSHAAEPSKRRSKAKAGQATAPLKLGPHADLVVNFGGSKSSQTRKTTTKSKTVKREKTNAHVMKPKVVGGVEQPVRQQPGQLGYNGLPREIKVTKDSYKPQYLVPPEPQRQAKRGRSSSPAKERISSPQRARSSSPTPPLKKAKWQKTD